MPSALPLKGKKILITRPQEQSQEWAQELQALGAETHILPLIKIVSIVDSEEIRAALQKLEQYNWLVFTSTNGVSSFFEACSKHFPNTLYMQTLPKIATVGPATTSELAKYKIKPDLTPQRFTGNDLAGEFGNVQGLKILFPTTTIAREDLSGLLIYRGAKLNKIPFYQTQITPAEDAQKLAKIISNGIDILTFASPSAVRSFNEKAAASEIKINNLLVACIGPATAEEAKKLGLKVDIQPDKYTTGGLTEAIIEYYERNEKQAAQAQGKR